MLTLRVIANYVIFKVEPLKLIGQSGQTKGSQMLVCGPPVAHKLQSGGPQHVYGFDFEDGRQHIHCIKYGIHIDYCKNIYATFDSYVVFYCLTI